MNQLAYHLLVAVSWLIGHCSVSCLRRFSNGLAWMAQHLFKYRLEVIVNNLQSTQVANDEVALNRLVRDNYRFIFDTFLLSLKVPYMRPSEIAEALQILDLSEIQSLASRHSKLILVFGHFGYWESLGSAPYYLSDHGIENVNIYKQLSFEPMNRLMIRLRGRHGSRCLESRQVLRHFISTSLAEGEGCKFISFLADQRPNTETSEYATMFLNRPTMFLTGWERLARRFDVPVVYLQLIPRGRMKLSAKFELLSEAPSQVEPYGLVEAYARCLERDIESAPHLWLWSHNRWHCPEVDPEGITLSDSLRANRAQHLSNRLWY